MKRYDLDTHAIAMAPYDDGDYVLHAEAEAELDTQEHRIANLSASRAGLALQIHALRRELEEASQAIHYPACWDTAAYPTLASALREIGFTCNHPDGCQTQKETP